MLSVERHEMLRWPNGSARGGEPFSFKPFMDAGDLELAIMTSAEMAQFHETKARYHLGDGETEMLVIAVTRGWRVATDDGPARKKLAAHNPAVYLTGTIGLLRDLVQGSAITKAEAITMLDLMRIHGGRLPDENF